MSIRTLTLAVLGAVSLSGCAYFAEKPVAGFGDSVNGMVEQQKFDPSAPQSAMPQGGMDGDKAAAALKAYRKGDDASSGITLPVVTLPGQ